MNARCSFPLVLGLLGVSAPLVGVRGQEQPPRLTVVLVVDQMRADHLTRFAGHYERGLDRLLRTGAVFTEALHDHARSETSPGHATIATGSFPSAHGIVANEWYDVALGRYMYSVEDATTRILDHPGAPGRSPSKLRRSTIGEWLKESSAGSKVFSVAAKDRSAILSAGRRADGVYWYNPTDGSFETSSYYRSDYPSWVDSFNLARPADRHFQDGWTKLKAVEFYFVSREDSFPAEYDGVHVTFPHVFSEPAVWARRYDELLYTPFSDELLMEFTRSLVLNEELGADEATDLLWIGLAAADYIGHRYGSLSQEVQDHFLRLDGYLGEFFDFLDGHIGVSNYTVVLTADHGVLPVPEELQRRGVPARRVFFRTLLSDQLDSVARFVTHDLGTVDPPFQYVWRGLVINPKATGGTVTRSRLLDLLAESLRQLPVIADVYAAEATSGEAAERPYARQYRQSFFAGRSPDLAIRFAPFTIIDDYPGGTSHGSPYRWDTLVPLVFAGGGAVAGRHRVAVRTVDIAPTLAEILGIPAAQGIDGRSLLPLVLGKR